MFQATPHPPLPPSSILFAKSYGQYKLLIVEYFLWGLQSGGWGGPKNERQQEINTTKALHTHHVAISGSHVLIMWNVCEDKGE
jgi:hypothetical protein